MFKKIWQWCQTRPQKQYEKALRVATKKTKPRPLFLPFADLFIPRREIARIKFVEKSEEYRALGALLLRNHSTRLYYDGSVGLTSTEQLELLRSRRIVFTILKPEAT